MTHTAHMTLEEVLATAKVGGFALVRLEITKIDRQSLASLAINSFGIWLQNDSIIAIEPPPQTPGQRIAELEALVTAKDSRIAELERIMTKAEMEAHWRALSGCGPVKYFDGLS